MARRRKIRRRPSAPVKRPVSLATGITVAGLLLGVFALYLGSYAYPLVFDDNYIANPRLGALLTAWAPLTNRWVSYTTFALTRELAGLHLPLLRAQNVALHAATVLTLFFFCRSLLSSLANGGGNGTLSLDESNHHANRAALAASAVFALHPIAVYAVAYLVQRSILMATFFSLLSLHALMVGALRPDRRWLVAAMVFYYLAIFSKENVVALPAVSVALLVLLRPLLRAPRSWLIGVVAAEATLSLVLAAKMSGWLGVANEPYVMEAISSSTEQAAEFAAAQAAVNPGAVPSAGTVPSVSPDPTRHLYPRSLITQAFLFFKYLLLWAIPWPGWLSVDMREPLARSILAWPQIAGAAAFLTYGIVAVRLLLVRGTTAIAGFALLAPWLLFATEFATVRLQEPFVLYRSYLWMPIPMLLVARAALWLPRRTLLWGGVAIAIVLAAAARERIQTFSTPLALWDDAVRTLPEPPTAFSDRAWSNRGVALLRENRFADARRDFDRAIALNPANAHAFASRSGIHVHLGDLARARADLDEAIRLRPRFVEALAERCGLRINTDDVEGALEDCQAAIRVEPLYPMARINRGVVFARQGELGLAMLDFEAALAVHPDNLLARVNRAFVLVQLGRGNEARGDLDLACRSGAALACEALRPRR